jgi:hypothetical protein
MKTLEKMRDMFQTTLGQVSETNPHETRDVGHVNNSCAKNERNQIPDKQFAPDVSKI